jgi:hypothetical protein
VPEAASTIVDSVALLRQGGLGMNWLGWAILAYVILRILGRTEAQKNEDNRSLVLTCLGMVLGLALFGFLFFASYPGPWPTYR